VARFSQRSRFLLEVVTAVIAEVLVTFLAFFGVITVTAVIFGVWVVLSILRMIFRALGWGARLLVPPTVPAQRRTIDVHASNVKCERPRCGAGNPPGARFCRRCGKRLAGERCVAVRRVAMW
jgi:hypothetical protein